MLFQMLVDYIEHKLYTSIEEVHEKIVVYHALDKLTDGEFLTLFDLLYPKVENEIDVDYGIALIPELEEVEEVEHGKAIIQHPMPQNALDILQKMVDKHLLKDENHKMEMYHETKQLTEEQINSLYTTDEVEDEYEDIDSGMMVTPSEEGVIETESFKDLLTLFKGEVE